MTNKLEFNIRVKNPAGGILTISHNDGVGEEELVVTMDAHAGNSVIVDAFTAADAFRRACELVRGLKNGHPPVSCQDSGLDGHQRQYTRPYQRRPYQPRQQYDRDDRQEPQSGTAGKPS